MRTSVAQGSILSHPVFSCNFFKPGEAGLLKLFPVTAFTEGHKKW